MSDCDLFPSFCACEEAQGPDCCDGAWDSYPDDVCVEGIIEVISGDHDGEGERCVQCDGQDPGDYCATRRPELSTCYADPFSAAQAIVRATARAPTTATARKRRGRRAAATATEICYSACRATVLLRIKDNLREDHVSCS